MRNLNHLPKRTHIAWATENKIWSLYTQLPFCRFKVDWMHMSSYITAGDNILGLIAAHVRNETERRK